MSTVLDEQAGVSEVKVNAAPRDNNDASTRSIFPATTGVVAASRSSWIIAARGQGSLLCCVFELGTAPESLYDDGKFESTTGRHERRKATCTETAMLYEAHNFVAAPHKPLAHKHPKNKETNAGV